MRTYDLSRVSDAALVRKLTVLLAEERISMAAVLAYLAEVDARRLYLPAGFPSMYAYCVGELHLCEQAAMKHIRAARTARRFPVIFSAVADGRLHLSAVVLLTPHLTSANAAELVAAAAYQTKAEVQQLWRGGSRNRTCRPCSKPLRRHRCSAPPRISRVAPAVSTTGALARSGLGDFHHPAPPRVRLAAIRPTA